ncbi:hypothetical protein VTL71DRAFT_11139 [Oculimacula yallundae]|uniref:Uncharacterized protein n=1 Tax=Oculimacula yallundae TaxID=86028 RepID=A0ABR4CVL8_9HELO
MAYQTNLPPGNTPGETKYTPEQMALLQAAMMEELGIKRIDSLHLADRGAPIEALQPLKQPKKRLNAATAGWHSELIPYGHIFARVHMFPTTAYSLLALYLEEGGDPTKADLDNIADGQLYRMRRGASSSGHRGNDTPRGGHFSNGNRGGGRGFRGGAGGAGGARGGRGAHGGRGGRQDDRPYVSSRTPATFFNDARKGLRSSNHLDQVFDRLRGTGSFVSNPVQQQSGNGPRDPPPDKRRQKPNTYAQPSKPLQQQSSSILRLDDGDSFLQWAKFSGSSNAQVPPKSEAVAGEASHLSRPSTHNDNNSVSASIPSTPGVASTSPAVNAPSSLGSQGLMGSKWGPPPQQVVQSKSTPAPAPQQPSSVPFPSLTPALPAPAVIRRNNVKVKKDNASAETECWAVLKKQNNSDELYNLEISDSTTGKILISSVVSHDAVFETDGCTVTYRAAQQTTEKPPTWKIRFQLPLHASSFAVLITRNRQDAGYITRWISDVGQASSDHSAGQQTTPHSAPEAIVTSAAQDLETGHAYERTLLEANDTSQTRYHVCSELGDGTNFATFGQDIDTDNVETLITLGDDGSVYTAPAVMNTDVFVLLEASDEFNLTESLYAVLGGDLKFFDKWTTMGGKPVDEVSLDELVSDSDYMSHIKVEIRKFLSKSEHFYILPEDYAKTLVQHECPKVVEFALSRRGLFLGSSAAISAADENTVEAELIEEENTLAASTQDTEPKDDTQTQTRASVEDDNSQHFPEHMKDSRIKYSLETLLALQDHAVAMKITEQPPLRSATTDPPLKPVTPFRAPQPVTSTNGWQAFSASHSKPKTPVLGDATISALVIPTESRISHSETVPDATSSAATSSKADKCGPSKLATNSWQLFAANEQLKTAAEHLEVSNREASLKVELPSAPANAWKEYAVVAESKTSSLDDDTDTSVKISLPGILEPDRDAENVSKPIVSHPSFAPDVSSTVVSPLKVQQTDDDGWATRLATAGALTPVIKSEAQVPRGILRHQPSMSDVNDRLAKSFSDLNLRTKVVEAATKPTNPTVETSLAAPPINIKVESSPVPSVASPNVAPRSSTPSSFTPAGQAMQDKIAAALKPKQSFVVSPFQSPASSFSRQSAVGGTIISAKSDLSTTTQVKLEKAASPKFTLVKPEPDSDSSWLRDNVINTAVPTVETRKELFGIALSDSQKAATIESTKVKSPETLERREKAEKVEEVNKVENPEFEGPVPAVAQPVKTSSTSDEQIKIVLQGSAGLSASKWANSPAAPQFTSARPPYTPQLPFQPIYQEQAPPLPFQPVPQGVIYPQGPHVHQAPTPGLAPMIATVLVHMEDGTIREVTGLYKAGSMPIVPHVPVPQMGHQAYAENVSPSSNGYVHSPNYPVGSAFPTRPPTHHQNQSSLGSMSDAKINTVAPMLTPSPQRPQVSAPQEQRPALSPRRANIQSQVQSRLNSSLNGVRNTYQGLQL